MQSAISLRPACGKYRHSLGVIYQANEKKKEAVEAFERANEKDPMNVQVLIRQTSWLW